MNSMEQDVRNESRNIIFKHRFHKEAAKLLLRWNKNIFQMR
jgi:hypothetical protein